MPRLKKLDVQGFKSFADPLTLVYPTGITAIVGPNGSGKSNVADAIRWVLGEQRMTAIRGRTGEDMIFAGSKKRARAGMARAAITFDNSDGWLPVDFAEVTVERRTYRDGKTDYMLNGTKVRLMDMRDLLDRAGLGRDAYLIIGQGLVDQVLSLRPTERLALFEQAAGIAPYRTRREDAVKKLEETHHNLERVQDIVGEIEPRLRRLERQAARVDQHAELSTVLNETLRVWYGYRWGKAVSNLEQARQRVTYREEKAFRRLEEVETFTENVATERRRMAALRARLAQLHQESSARHGEAEGFQRELAVARERRRQLQERREESRANLVPLRSALEAEAQEVEALQAALAEAAAQVAEERARLAEAEAAYREVEQQRHAILARQSRSQAQALESRHQLADRQSRLEQSSARVAQLAERVAELEAALEGATARRRERQSAVEAARREFEEADAALQAEEGGAERLQAALETARSESEALRRTLGEEQSTLQQLSARLAALERLHAEGAGLYAGVREVLQAVDRGELQGLPGTVASLIRVPPELDRAIETALGSQLQNVVAASWDDAREAIAWLKRRRAGRATFLPLDTIRPSRPLDLQPRRGIVGLASDLVGYDPRYRRVALMLLGRTVVAETLDAARELHRDLRGGFQIVTLDGEILRSSGSVTGGENRQSRDGGLLARERERRELPEQVEALEARVHELRAALKQNEVQAHELNQEIRAQAERRRTAERRRQEADRRLEREVRDLDKLIQEMAWQEKLLEEAREEQAQIADSRGRLEAERQAAERSLAEAEAQLAEIARELDALTDDEAGQVVADRRTQVALLEQEHDNRRVLLETRQREVQRLERQIDGQEHRIRSLEGELSKLGEGFDELQARYEEIREAAEVLSSQIPSLEAELAGMEEALEANESREQEMRRALREAEQRLSQAELDANRREDQVQALRREIEEALGIVLGDLPASLSGQQPLPLDAIVSPLPIVAELPEGLEQQIRDLRTQIRRLEPVNPGAKEEYVEVAERHRFLREQVEDLETASAHLNQIIDELDQMMETTFRVTFKGIASEFSRIFELLFNGGTSKLTLESDDGEIAGVEIMARPPGKRTSGLGMLSGGERTLTAVALIFAVMRVSPTPFCILDEVDAMLDEANVGRFRSMLRDLARQTQFIIITHNRGTVEVSDTIYGVSMGEDGASQILSLSLEDLPPSEEI